MNKFEVKKKYVNFLFVERAKKREKKKTYESIKITDKITYLQLNIE